MAGKRETPEAYAPAWEGVAGGPGGAVAAAASNAAESAVVSKITSGRIPCVCLGDDAAKSVVRPLFTEVNRGACRAAPPIGAIPRIPLP